MSEPKTPEQKKAELDARVKGFNEELLVLLEKYKLGLGALPMLTADGRVGARPQVFDDTEEARAAADAAMQPPAVAKDKSPETPGEKTPGGLAKPE